MKYCSECGTKLIEKECGIDGLVPYCPTCKQLVFQCLIVLFQQLSF